MANPVVVEVTRGPLVESRHRGAGAVVDADGAIVFAFGEIERPVFPRSAVKAFQALPLVESGAADKLGLERRGDRARLRVAFRASGACRPARPRCSPRPGRGERARLRRALAARRRGVARACARRRGALARCTTIVRASTPGFLCLACACGWDIRGYETAAHPRSARGQGGDRGVTGAALGEDVCGTDGCSIPTYAVPLRALALGFARFGTGAGLAPAPRRRAGASSPPSPPIPRWSPARGGSTPRS